MNSAGRIEPLFVTDTVQDTLSGPGSMANRNGRPSKVSQTRNGSDHQWAGRTASSRRANWWLMVAAGAGAACWAVWRARTAGSYLGTDYSRPVRARDGGL